MKTNKVLFLALIVCAAFAVSAQADDRHRSNGNARSNGSAPARYSGGAIHSNSGVRYGGNRTFAPSPRMTTRSIPQFSQRRAFSGGNAPIVRRQFTSRTFNRSNGVARFQNNQNFGTTQNNQRSSSLGNSNRNFNRTGPANRTAQFGNGGRNRTIGNISPGHNHVFAQQSANWNRNWDRHSDHWWNGHRCRWVNNSWFIFDIGFIPWFGWPYYDYYAYDYYPPVYPYGYGYGYNSGAYSGSNNYDQNGYDSSYDDQGGPNSYDQSRNNNSYNESVAVTVADVQDQLARAGYYHGQIDGVLGPETRHALLSYQSAKGLRMTGSLTTETQQSLGLTAQGGDQITDQ
jgi:hypothetical protein